MTRTEPGKHRDPSRATEALARELMEVVGEARVRPSPNHPGVLIARVSETDAVRTVLQLARDHRVPLLPRAPGLDLSAITPPPEGGIALDLSPMNRIIEVEHSRRYAVIEPGVTWRSLDARLREDGSDLSLPFPAAPANVGPWTSCLFDGAEGMTLGLGDVGRSICGLEAVLPSGEVVRTGARSASNSWWGRGLHPDLTNMFARWRGSTGIVTRLSICLEHRRRHSRRLLLPSSVRRAAIAASIRLARTGLFDEAHVVSWTLLRLLLGAGSPGTRHAGEPEAWLAVDFSADTLPELEYKRVRLAQALSRATRRGGKFEDPVPLGSLTRVEPLLEPLEDLPVALPLAGGGGSRPLPRVLGFHGPVSTLVDGAGAAEIAYSSRDLPAAVLVRPVPGGHFGTIHVLLSSAGCPGASPATIDAAEADAIYRLCAAGFVPHRYPGRLSEVVCSRLEPSGPALGEKMRSTLDPENLLDPERWGLSRPYDMGG